jgi:hypothetical protein
MLTLVCKTTSLLTGRDTVGGLNQSIDMENGKSVAFSHRSILMGGAGPVDSDIQDRALLYHFVLGVRAVGVDGQTTSIVW